MYIHIGHNRMHNLSKSSFQTENINKSCFFFCLFLNSQLCTFLQSFFKYSSGWQVISLHRTIRILLHSQSSSFFFSFLFLIIKFYFPHLNYSFICWVKAHGDVFVLSTAMVWHIKNLFYNFIYFKKTKTKHLYSHWLCLPEDSALLVTLTTPF